MSESKSMEGWNFKTWFKGNWKTIKEILKAGIPLVLGWVATNHPGWTGLITIVGKFLLDCGEYYFKKQ